MDTKEISFNELQHICRDLYTNMCNPEIDNIKLSDILGDRELSREIGEFLEGKIAKENEYLNNEGRPLNSLPYGKCVDWNGQFTGKAGSVMLGRFFSLFIFGKSWGGDDGMGQFNVRHKRDPHFIPNLKFHCYAFNNNSDVLFSKKTHKFSENCMKYDFEDGYHETPDTSQQHISPQPTISHSGQSKANNNAAGCVNTISIIVIIASLLFIITKLVG